MFMLCYKNGSLAREQVRDAINDAQGSSALEDKKSWDAFNEAALTTPVLGQETSTHPMRVGLFFPKREIVPDVHEGVYRFLHDNATMTPLPEGDKHKHWNSPNDDARAILESQFLSLRLRSQALLRPFTPPQPRRLYLVGGASANSAIVSLAAQVLGSSDGVYALTLGGNACALGAAYKAAWGVGRQAEESFEDFLEARWDEGQFARKVADGCAKDVWERYGEGVKVLEEVERYLLEKQRERRGSEE